MQASSITLYSVWMGVQGRLELERGWGDNGSHSREDAEGMYQGRVCQCSLQGEEAHCSCTFGSGGYDAPLRECVAEKTHACHDNRERERYWDPGISFKGSPLRKDVTEDPSILL